MSFRKTILDAFWQCLAILVLATVISFAVNHFRNDRLPIFGDWSPKQRLSGLNSLEEAVVSLEEARALFLTRGAIFIDARPRDVFEIGHIEGALNIPLDTMDEHLPGVMAEIPPNALLITYCDGEACELSKELAVELTAKGYSHVRVLVNGWTLWQDANLPVEIGSN